MPNNTEDFKLIDYINIILKYKKPIALFTIFCTLVALFMVFFVIDPIYYSYSTVKTTTKGGDISSLVGGAGLSGMDLGEFTGGGSVYKELALYENILISRRSLEDLIIKFNIMEKENIKYMNDALKYVRKNVIEIQKDKIAGTMEIGVYDKDPERAKEIVEYLVNTMNKINIELNVLNAKNNREFIETRYNLAKEDLKKCEDTLKNFQDKYGISPDIQIKAASQLATQLEVEIKSEEVKLDILKKILSTDQPEVKLQSEKINLLKSNLENIKNSDNDNDILSLKGKPDIAINFVRLTRNIEIQSKIITFLLPMYEQAKIEEKRETPSVLILDSPFVPDKKISPKRLNITIIVFFLSIFISCGFVILKEKWIVYKGLLKYK